MLASSRAHGRTSWRPGPGGRARLRALRSAGMAPALPESPQHRAWREARAAARARIGVFRVQLADAARELETLAARDPPPASDALLALGAGVADRARRLASAVHCLHEWHEPDDAHADVDTIDQPAAPAAALGAASFLTASRLGALRAGRRNVRLWDEPV